MLFEILYGISGWGKTRVEAADEAAARAMFDDGEWRPADDNPEYVFESVELAPKPRGTHE